MSLPKDAPDSLSPPHREKKTYLAKISQYDSKSADPVHVSEDPYYAWNVYVFGIISMKIVWAETGRDAWLS